ncbi:MAG: DUF2510 domain-containing protein [Propionibacteriaceae bacterium]|jgi:hypothetical protein|nr:DUF2510 domain-containing protein [Propionibacteriaceae bacterium]
MSKAGWYPDPGGQSGQYRYWDGNNWTTSVSADPQGQVAAGPQYPAQPPTQGYGQQGYGAQPGWDATQPIRPGTQPVQPGAYGQYPDRQNPYGQQQYGAGGYAKPYYQTQSRGGSKAWWVVLGIVVLAIVLVVVWVVNSVSTVSPIAPNPSGTATQNICPDVPVDDEEATEPMVKGNRVYGGKLSYEELGSPWGEVAMDSRVAYNSLAATQTVLDQLYYDGGSSSWVASVLVSELFIGDGFASTKQGAEMLMKCVLGEFYSNTELARADARSESFPVDGHDGWLIETTVEFNIPGLIATSEQIDLIVVQTSVSGYSMFYSSVPNTLAELLPDVERTMAGLAVDD